MLRSLMNTEGWYKFTVSLFYRTVTDHRNMCIFPIAFMFCRTPSNSFRKILFRSLRRKSHVWRTREIYTTFVLESVMGWHNSGGLGVHGTIISSRILGKWGARLRAGFHWFKKGLNAGLSWARLWTSRFHKIQVISWPAEWLLGF
jgi:hypothetical protein